MPVLIKAATYCYSIINKKQYLCQKIEQKLDKKVKKDFPTPSTAIMTVTF